MLFNSATFVFAFLPVTLFAVFATARLLGRICAAAVLVAASLAFYGWDDPRRLLPLILASMAFNFTVSRCLVRRPAKSILAVGVLGDLAALGYFKYADLIIRSYDALSPLAIPEAQVVLPIGISFYTFTQIAFLVDVYRGRVGRCGPLSFANFVTLFPHLIAGPIIHLADTMPQIEDPRTFRFDPANFTYGLTYFVAGLFKKVVLADAIGPYADAFFTLARQPTGWSGLDAWIGALSYTFQLYFDFSGYSDMAIGLALMLNIRFPVNFDSPYKALSLVDFWGRWHITLSRFLRDYLYIPLGGNRRGPRRRYANLMITMVLGGLWHGALWNFAVWGGLQGCGLVVNHLWRRGPGRCRRMPAPFAWALTFGFIVVARVPFRAETLTQSAMVWSAMLGPGLTRAPAQAALTPALPVLALLSAIALLAPNTQAIFGYGGTSEPQRRPIWTMSLPWALGMGCAFALSLVGMVGRPTTFLYFRF